MGKVEFYAIKKHSGMPFSVAYDEDVKGVRNISSVFVAKKNFVEPKNSPKRIKVTVEWEEDDTDTTA